MLCFSELYVWKRDGVNGYGELNHPEELEGELTLSLVSILDLELHCKMDFYLFPFDNHVRKIFIEKAKVCMIFYMVLLPLYRNADTW